MREPGPTSDGIAVTAQDTHPAPEKEPDEAPVTAAPAGGMGVGARLARLWGPLYSLLYDLQMQTGRGVLLTQHKLVLPQYPREAPALRVGFISDMHYGPTSGHVALRQAWDHLHQVKPDVLLLGGDFFYADQRGLPALMRELQRWKRIDPAGGMYAVLGNHDYKMNHRALQMCLEACHVRVLVNQAVELPVPWRNVWISGCDDTTSGDPQPELAMAEVPVGACSIMVSHSPDVCEYAVLKRCGLTLCGHTHGGQVCLPGGDAPYLPSKWGRHYPAGLHRHAGNWVFVSRGVGTVGLPVRLWAPPDVALFEVAANRGGIWKR